MSKGFIIAIDFDGTVVKHAYPKVGEDIPHAVRVLKRIIENGHNIMLWTMRGNQPGNLTLKDATDWYAKHDITLWGVNENPDQTASGWTNSHKQHHDLLIDDIALGVPLLQEYKIIPPQEPIAEGDVSEPIKVSIGSPYVDWLEVEKLLINRGVIKI